MSNDLIDAAAFYIRVCVEHSLRFPLRNILVVSDDFAGADDEERFAADVEEVVDRYRLGEEIDGMDGALRDEFGAL